MQISTRCSVAIHCLIFICEANRVGSAESGVRVTSVLLSESTGTNAVSIRNALGALKRAGLITVARGTGGAELAHTPKEITLLDIYQAVESTNLDDVIGIHESGNHTCPVARNIHDVLKDTYAPVAKAMSDSMREVTLANMLADHRNRIGVKAQQLEQ